MTATGLWLRILVATGLAVGSVFVLDPDRPEVRVAPGLSAAAGVFVGLLLVVGVTGGCPTPARGGQLRLLATKALVVGLLAVNEELLWRRALLGELLQAGTGAALAGSTLLFAVAHRGRPGLHLLTGAAFGGLYAATGVLAASVAAHWTYNLLLATRAGAGR